MRGIKTKLLSALAAISLMASYAVVPVFADTGMTAAKVRRSVDSTIEVKQYSMGNLSSYIYRDNLNKFYANRFTSAYAATKPVYNGEKSFRINYYNKNGDELTDTLRLIMSNTTATARGVDVDNMALRFMYNPAMAREETYVGIICRTKKGVSASQNSAALKIRLDEYIELKSTDYSKDVWIPVTIPVTYFFENGIFDPMGGTETDFKRHCINGMMLEYSTENLPSVATSGVAIAYIDDAEFVEVVKQPQNMRYVKSDDSVTVSWNGLSQNTADKYLVYRDGVLVSELEGEASYTDNTVSGTGKYLYSVCSVANDGYRSVTSHIEVDMSSDDGNYTETEQRILYSCTEKAQMDDDLPLIINWNRHSSATEAGVTYGTVAGLPYFAAGSSPMHKRTAAAESFTVPDEDRYRIIPITTLTRTDTGIKLGTEPKRGATFASQIEDLDTASIVIDAAKGKGYNSNIKGIKVGLAYIDLNTVASYTYNGANQNVYATGIKWCDVTDQFTPLAAFSDSNTWESAKGDIRVDISDILSNGTEKYLHGATAATHEVTLANANAIAVDVVTGSSSYSSSSPVVILDNIIMEKTHTGEISTGGDLNIDIELSDKAGKVYNNKDTLDAYPDRVRVRTDNATGFAKTAKLAAAMYDDSGYLVDIDTFDVAIPVGKDSTTLYPNFYQAIPGSYTLKFFAFENYGTIKPITSKVKAEYTVSLPSSKKNVTVLDTEYQTVTGWGISPFYISEKDFKTFSEYEEWPEIYDTIYGEMGITSVRVPIDKECGYTEEPAEELKDKPIASELDYVVKYIERAKDFGIDDWILCFWSAPKYMIEKRYIADREADLYCIKSEYKDTYCSYIINVLDYLVASGVGMPQALCFQNEPGGGTVNPFFTREDYVYTSIKLRSMLDENGYADIPLSGFESSGYHNCHRYSGGSYTNVGYNYLVSNPQFAATIGVFSSHAYTGEGETDADIQRFINLADKLPGRERWMTEVSGLGLVDCTLSDGSMDYVMGPAINTMRLLCTDMAWIGMNRYYYWRAYVSHYNNDANGASYDVLGDQYAQQAVVYGTNGGRLVKSKLYDCLKILFNSVPVGSKVKRVSTTDTTLVNKVAIRSDLVAFETEKGTVVMLVNKSETSKSMDFAGLSGNSAKVMNVTKDHDVIELNKDVTSGSVSDVHIPPRSVTFIITD